MEIELNSLEELQDMYKCNLSQWLRSDYSISNIEENAFTVYDENEKVLFKFIVTKN